MCDYVEKHLASPSQLLNYIFIVLIIIIDANYSLPYL